MLSSPISPEYTAAQCRIVFSCDLGYSPFSEIWLEGGGHHTCQGPGRASQGKVSRLSNLYFVSLRWDVLFNPIGCQWHVLPSILKLFMAKVIWLAVKPLDQGTDLSYDPHPVYLQIIPLLLLFGAHDHIQFCQDGKQGMNPCFVHFWVSGCQPKLQWKLNQSEFTLQKSGYYKVDSDLPSIGNAFCT